MKRILFAFMLCGAACGATAGVRAAGVNADIEYLLLKVQQSPCEFQRNGSVYTGEQAARHLRQKLAAAPAGIDVEQFISRIASKSSISGKPYLVRCTPDDVQPSEVWLHDRLRERRG